MGLSPPNESVSYISLEVNICASMRVKLSFVFVKNKGADQSALPRSLISTLVIHLMEGIIS